MQEFQRTSPTVSADQISPKGDQRENWSILFGAISAWLGLSWPRRLRGSDFSKSRPQHKVVSLGGTGLATLQKVLKKIGETSQAAFRDQFKAPRDYLMLRPDSDVLH